MTAALAVRPIRDPAEREILARYAQGHDTLRLAAGTGRGEDSITALIAAVAGYDRGRAARAVHDWDAVQKRQTAAPAVDAGPTPAELCAEVDRLRKRLHDMGRQTADIVGGLRKELTDTKQRLAAKHTELLAAQKQAHDGARVSELEAELVEVRLQLAQAKRIREGSRAAKRIEHIEAEMVAAEQRFADDLKQMSAHLSSAVEMADLYKARLDRLHELVGWARKGSGASILIDTVRAALDGDGEPT